ncbi:MAG: AbrB/MazE/SpoVT family DNA-binding domain-containing protein [Methylococcaceae bacterium]|nr:MAG: AbrB/MazE/SpoVT family DNA-binding domain-containing protein [Methylococcaceae bacterium]
MENCHLRHGTSGKQPKVGARLTLEIADAELKMKPARRRKSLAELLAATPDGLHRAEGWDERPTAGTEQ